MTSSLHPSSLGVVRRSDTRVLSGLAAGIADRFGIPTVYVRAAFIVTALMWGLGVFAYLAGWAATLDTSGTIPSDRTTTKEQRAGLALGFLGFVLVIRAVGVWPGDGIFWPAAALTFGAAFLLDQRDIDSRSALLRIFDPSTGNVRTRTVAGIVLLLVGLGLFGSAAVPGAGVVVLAVLVTGVGLLLAFGPWAFRTAGALGEERKHRIREEERAEMAAHLHDSVLQTLAMIQRTDDPKRMVTLARSQERELRRWLYEKAQVEGEERLSTLLHEAADRVEADFDVQIEVVNVGDVTADPRIQALVGAASEAMANAAKHAGVERISLYSEVGDGVVQAWISDQGRGFLIDEVGGDRRGIRESITGRMERHGGVATINSAAGEGTEIHLSMKMETS
ncbi:MAG: PspC domain-containing protein [Acidimicrobiia bacterium]|nr:PspC domain-containing protein [Acidimicrobiia bacterium]